MKKQVKSIIIGITFAALAIIGIQAPAMDTAADEPTPINKFTLNILEEHKAEVEKQKANDARCLAHLSDKIDEYKRIDMAKKAELKGENNSQPNTANMTSIGTYELTAYIATGNPCASGVYPTVNHTVACNSLPLGTHIYIEGYGEYVVEDTGGMGGGVIDVFVADYSSAISFGRRTANVYIIEQ